MMSFAQSVLNASPNKGPWEQYKVSPESRTIYPTKVFATEGVVADADNLVGNTDNVASLEGEGAAISLDFGFNTCGIYAIEFADGSTANQSVHVTFSETNLFVDKDNSDRSMDFVITDGTVEVPVRTTHATYKCSYAKQRGAFRYMTVSTRKPGSVKIKKVYTVMNNMPSLGDDLRNYSGYFYSDDEFANTIWYAGAYTIQLAIIPSKSGRRMDIVMPAVGWCNDDTSGYGEEVLVDGARRDRSVWSGDRAISQQSEFIAFNSKAGELGTDWILNEQKPNGQFPYACAPIFFYGSDTYHLWTLKSIYNTYMLNGKPLSWLKDAWPQYKKGMAYAWNMMDDTGLLKVGGPLDWGRTPLSGHQMSVNCILYTTLVDGATIAGILDDPETAKVYKERAVKLKTTINKFFWDAEVGAFKDSDENNLHPQDGNALSLLLHVADEDKKEQISHYLSTNWNQFGAIAPEMQNSISPFISSFELLAHTEAGYAERSYELFRTMWGYIWNSPYAVKSSLIEGYFNDGSLKYPFDGYDSAYISHCHPWSTGPTIWLTRQIVGLSFENSEHTRWSFHPRGVFVKGALHFAQTGFTSRTAGFISAGWKRHGENVLQLVVRCPEGTTGNVVVPSKSGSKITKLTVNGDEAPVSQSIEVAQSSDIVIYYA